MAGLDTLNTASPSVPPDLVDASWRGVFMQVARTTDAVQRAVATHSYPHVDGDDLEDLGAQARRVSLDVVFYGENYQQPLNAFLQASALPGSGELVHPVFGTMRAQLMSVAVEHDAEQPCYCMVRCEFTEHLVGAPAFSRFTPAYRASAIEVAADAVLVAGRVPFENAVVAARAISSGPGLLERMAGALDTARAFARTVGSVNIRSLGLNYLSAPFAFVQDMKSIYKSRLQELVSPFVTLKLAVGGAPGWSGVAGWRQALTDLRQPLLQTSSAPDFLGVHLQQQQAVAVAMLCKEVFQAEIDAPSLPPLEIEALATQARSDLQAALMATRLLYPNLVDSRPMTEALKATAAAVQETALALIRLRPPFVTHVVPSRMNLHLLAHSLYADYTRADELLRLNPKIRSPNLLNAALEVQGYVA